MRKAVRRRSVAEELSPSHCKANQVRPWLIASCNHLEVAAAAERWSLTSLTPNRFTFPTTTDRASGTLGLDSGEPLRAPVPTSAGRAV